MYHATADVSCPAWRYENVRRLATAQSGHHMFNHCKRTNLTTYYLEVRGLDGITHSVTEQTTVKTDEEKEIWISDKLKELCTTHNITPIYVFSR